MSTNQIETFEPKPDRLIISNLHFERSKTDIRVYTTGGRLVTAIHQNDYLPLAEFLRKCAGGLPE